MSASASPSLSPCPCGSGRSYDDCCGRYHSGSATPETAEALMRARYSAYAVGAVDYLVQTVQPKDRSTSFRLAAREWSKNAEWLGLEILSAKGGEADQDGRVEFVARFRQQGEEQSHHEISRFQKKDGKWLFLEGKVLPSSAPAVASVPRSAPCPCGSGKKYKRCCGAGAAAE